MDINGAYLPQRDNFWAIMYFCPCFARPFSIYKQIHNWNRRFLFFRRFHFLIVMLTELGRRCSNVSVVVTKIVSLLIFRDASPCRPRLKPRWHDVSLFLREYEINCESTFHLSTHFTSLKTRYTLFSVVTCAARAARTRVSTKARSRLSIKHQQLLS